MVKLLFIIGSSRSGSKMIRDMLNNVDSICITSTEMKIVPYLISQYASYSSIVGNNLKRLYKELETSTYAVTMKNGGNKYEVEDFLNDNEGKEVFEILKNYVCFYEGKDATKVNILGDKTPSYHKKLDVLSSIKHKIDVKIIHMIRDPRDVALSFKKSWGKSLYRSSFKWNIAVNNILKFNKTDYLHINTIRYEDVLTRTVLFTDGILNYLDITVDDKKNLWDYNSSEVYGTASGYKGIKKDNLNKFESELSQKQIKAIENICFSNMQNFSYPIHYSKNSKEANKLILIILFFYDNFMYIKHIVFKERGFKNGINFLIKTYKRYFNERGL